MSRTRGGATLSRWRLLNARELRVHWVRAVVTLVVIAVSSALLVAVLGTYGSLTGSVEKLSQTVASNADLEVTGVTDTGFDAALAPLIARQPGVRAAVPMLWTTVRDGDQSVTVFGVDASVTNLEGSLRDAAEGALTGLGPESAGSVLVGPGMGDRSTGPGGTVRLVGADYPVAAVLGGPELERLNGGRFVIAPLPVAQQITGRAGSLDTVFVLAADGADPGALRAQLEQVVQGRALVAAPAYRSAQAGTAIGLTRDSTLLVALIGLVVAAFLVYNSMNMAAAQRRPHIAMLRALGGRRRALARDMLAEAAVMGLVGGAVGVPLGVVMGSVAIGQVPPILVQSFSAQIEFILPWYAAPVAVLSCVLACVAASAFAARQVFGVAPIEAMQPAQIVEHTVATQQGKRRMVTQLLVGAVGIAVMVASVVAAFELDDRRSLAAGGTFAIGGLLLCYALTSPIAFAAARVAGLCGAPGRLGSASAERSPSRVWATAMTVTIAVAVVVSTSGSMRNLVDSASGTFESLRDVDLYVTASPVDVIPSGPVLAPELTTQLLDTPGVAQVVAGQWAYANLGEAKVMIQGVSPGSSAPSLRAMTEGARAALFAQDGVVVSRQLAKLLRVEAGDEVDMSSPTGLRTVRILEVIDYLTVGAGMIVMPLPMMQQYFDREGATFLEIVLAAGADPQAVAAVVRELDPGLVISTGEEAFGEAKKATEQAGALALGVQWIVAVVAAVALLNTLMLSVLQRRRELGMLRAMGSSRRFASGIVVSEAVAVGVVGAAIGLVFGTALHYVATVVLSATTSVQISFALQPVAWLYAGIAALLSMAGAVPPAWRAGQVNIVEAVSAE